MEQPRSLEHFLTTVQQRDPNQPEFLQAVREVMTTLWPFLEQNLITAMQPCLNA